PADKVVRLAETLIELGCDEVGLSDSVGYANPAQIKELVVRVRAAVGERALAGLHLHNTRGLGLANVLAGLEIGLRTFDSSLGGLGGCPWAPRAAAIRPPDLEGRPAAGGDVRIRPGSRFAPRIP